MPSRIALATVVLIIAGSAATAAPLKVGVAATSVPPFFAPDASGKYSGWEIDIIDAVCSDQKLYCVITPVAWASIIPALTSGQIDIIMSSMSITKARQQVIDFSDKYYEPLTTVVGLKDVRENATPDGLAGKTIGVLVSSTHETYAHKHYPQSSVKLYQTPDDAYQDLTAGRIDAVVNEELFQEKFLESAAGDCCELKGKVQPDLDVYGPGIGAGFRKGDSLLVAKINQGIRDIRENGTYDKISGRYFNQSIPSK